MHPLDILQWVYLVYPHVELAVGDPAEEFFGISCKLFSSYDIVEERGAEESNVLGGESAGKHCSDWSAPVVIARSIESAYLIAKGGTAPEAFPNETKVPFRLTSCRSSSKVVFPTPSKTTSTPLPSVISKTLETTSLFSE
jgi:hypothetical protein